MYTDKSNNNNKENEKRKQYNTFLSLKIKINKYILKNTRNSLVGAGYH